MAHVHVLEYVSYNVHVLGQYNVQYTVYTRTSTRMGWGSHN